MSRSQFSSPLLLSKHDSGSKDLFPEENIDTGDIPSSDRGNSESEGCDTPILQNDSILMKRECLRL